MIHNYTHSHSNSWTNCRTPLKSRVYSAQQKANLNTWCLHVGMYQSEYRKGSNRTDPLPVPSSKFITLVTFLCLSRNEKGARSKAKSANNHRKVSSHENISTDDRTNRFIKKKLVNYKVKLNSGVLVSSPIFFSKTKPSREGYEVDSFDFCILII